MSFYHMWFYNTYYLTFFKNKSRRTETGKAFQQRRGLNFLEVFLSLQVRV